MSHGGPGPFTFSSSPEFVRRFAAGDRDALEQVYIAYLDEVDRMVSRFLRTMRDTGRRSQWADAQDLIQEVFTRAFSRKATTGFDGVRPYGAFLATLTRNVLVDWARRRRPQVPLEVIEHAIAAEDDPSEACISAEVLAVVQSYLAGLGADVRAVHEARYVRGLSQEEACRALGLTRQKLRTKEKHLRRGLQTQLKRARLHDVTRARATDLASVVGEISTTRSVRT